MSHKVAFIRTCHVRLSMMFSLHLLVFQVMKNNTINQYLSELFCNVKFEASNLYIIFCFRFNIYMFNIAQFIFCITTFNAEQN
jgi:hypothetical protein